MTTIVLFQNDLRLKDNPALYHAARKGEPIVCLYVLDESREWKLGKASKWWLHHSLESLESSLDRLIFRKGPIEKVVTQVMKECGADTIYYNRVYDRTIKIKEEQRSFSASLLFEPWDVQNKQGQPFKVFTPFWKTCMEMGKIPKPLPKPKCQFYKGKLKSDRLTDWKLLNKQPDLGKFWEPGEASAHKRLRNFINNKLSNYEKDRDFPGKEGTSRLSPHLHFGEISPRQIWEALGKHSATQFRAELGWREFCYHLLYHFPNLPHQPFQNKFTDFPWEIDPKGLKAWQRGETGHPIIDAGMRQLWQTGWMHNRVRMIVASFLTKDLFIHWVEGEKWFWNTLVDADLANNAAGWQWVAGSGADAAPYFRVFNPSLQGEKFDPDGTYVKKWIPELNKLPAEVIHQPWKASESIDYPLPIVDHKQARDKALSLYEKIK